MSGNTVLFRKGQIQQQKMRLGEVFELIRACYFRGKELGYSNGDIYFEWPKRICFDGTYRYGRYYPFPTHSELPIQFVDYENVDLSKFDKIYDLNQYGVFYENSPPIYLPILTEDMILTDQIKCYISHLSYLNKYYLETKERPIFNIPKDETVDNPSSILEVKKSYILFHVRIANWSEYRNPDLNVYKDVVLKIKEIYGDKYEYWKCGETCNDIDSLFDRVLPYFKELDNVIKQFNNASLIVCADSGPNVFGWGLGIPVFEIECPRFGRGPGVYHYPEFWKNFKGEYGNTPYDWLEKDKFKVFYKGDTITKDDIFSFTSKWL